jgi:hypothetical protein
MIARIAAAVTATRLKVLEEEKRKKKNPIPKKKRNKPKNVSRGFGRFIGRGNSKDTIDIDSEY